MPEIPEDSHTAWGGDTTSDTVWITNGNAEQLLQPLESIPIGWKKGRKSSLPFKNPLKQKELSGRANPEKHRQGLKDAWASGKFANRDNSKLGGALHTEETKQHLSNVAKNRERLACPHCSTTATAGMAKRWHFDNCKTLYK